LEGLFQTLRPAEDEICFQFARMIQEGEPLSMTNSAMTLSAGIIGVAPAPGQEKTARARAGGVGHISAASYDLNC
jgi:hypothetical protein